MTDYNPAAILALQALRDCGVIRASVSHSGYRALRDKALVSFVAAPSWGGERCYNHRLTPRGRHIANSIIK